MPTDPGTMDTLQTNYLTLSCFSLTRNAQIHFTMYTNYLWSYLKKSSLLHCTKSVTISVFWTSWSASFSSASRDFCHGCQPLVRPWLWSKVTGDGGIEETEETFKFFNRFGKKSKSFKSNGANGFLFQVMRYSAYSVLHIKPKNRGKPIKRR